MKRQRFISTQSSSRGRGPAYRQIPSNKLKLKSRFILVSGGTIVLLTFSMGWLIFLNISLNTKIKASANGSGGSLMGNGELVAEFTWEQNEAAKANIGPDAIKISDHARTAAGGRDMTKGLSPGTPAKEINMELASMPLYDGEGIDISIDFRRHEAPKKGASYHAVQSGSFFTRGKSLDFGFKKGFLAISYRVTTPSGYETINETTDYEIPQDEQFRNYRFIYTPTTGEAEIFVDNVIVWKHSNTTFFSPSSELSTDAIHQVASIPMYWTDAGNIIIGKGIDGGGIDSPVLDNLVIRIISTAPQLSASLISFILENSADGVMIYWSTIVNGKVDYFAIERSINGTDFQNIENIATKEESNEVADYYFEDKTVASQGVYFYRLRQIFKEEKGTVRHVSTEAVSAIKIKPIKMLTIDKVSPDTFQTSFNLSYYAPSPGRIWIQLTDENGKTKANETFETTQGRNIYFFRDKNNLSAGDYTLHLIQNDKRVSAKVTKLPTGYASKTN